MRSRLTTQVLWHRWPAAVLAAILLMLFGPCPALGQTWRADGTLAYGLEGFPHPTIIRVNGNSPRTVQLLIDAFRAEEATHRRVQLLGDLGRCRRAEAIPLLLEALAEKEPAIRAQAAAALAAVVEHQEPTISGWVQTVEPPDPQIAGQRDAVLERLQALLVDADASVRAQAIQSIDRLAPVGQPEHNARSAAVARAMEDAEPLVTLAGLAAVRTPEQAHAVARSLPTLSPAVQPQAILALGRVQAPAHADQVSGFLDSGSVPQRAAALDALGQMRATGHLPQVLACLEDRHATIRRQAVRALLHLAAPQTRRELGVRMLADPDPTVRAAAVELAASAPAVQIVEPIVRQLPDAYRPLHRTARNALVIAEPREVREACIAAAARLLDDADPRRREDGSYILGELRSDAAFERHVALLEIPDSKGQVDVHLLAQVARSLGQIGDRRAADAVTRFALHPPGTVVDPQTQVRASLNAALGEALLAAGHLRCEGVMPTIAATFHSDWGPGGPRPYEGMMGPAAWAFGILGQQADPSLKRRAMELVKHRYLAADARAELAKAFVNLRAKDVADELAAITPETIPPLVVWMAHWAADELRGTQTPYVPPRVSWQADVSIMDLTEPAATTPRRE